MRPFLIYLKFPIILNLYVLCMYKIDIEPENYTPPVIFFCILLCFINVDKIIYVYKIIIVIILNYSM